MGFGIRYEDVLAAALRVPRDRLFVRYTSRGVRARSTASIPDLSVERQIAVMWFLRCHMTEPGQSSSVTDPDGRRIVVFRHSG